MERTCYHAFCWQIRSSHPIRLWQVGRTPSSWLLHVIASINASIRPHPPIRNCWLSASKHSHETFLSSGCSNTTIMNLLRESIASKLPEIIWSHTRCLQLKGSQRNCILALCRNGCELQLINREKARRQIVMQQRAGSYLCFNCQCFFCHKSDRNVDMNGWACYVKQTWMDMHMYVYLTCLSTTLLISLGGNWGERTAAFFLRRRDSYAGRSPGMGGEVWGPGGCVILEPEILKISEL